MKFKLEYARLVILSRDIEAETQEEADKKALDLEDVTRELGINHGVTDGILCVAEGSVADFIGDYDEIWSVKPIEEGE